MINLPKLKTTKLKELIRKGETKRQSESTSIIKKSTLTDLKFTQSILVKMVAVFLLLIIIPVAVIGYISTSTASNSLVSKSEESIASSTMQTSNYFDLILNKVEDISLQLFSNSSIQKYGIDQLADTDVTTVIKDQQDANNAINSFANINSGIAGITVLYESGKTAGSISVQPDMNKIKSASWYKKVDESTVPFIWTGNHDDGIENFNSNKYCVSLMRKIKDINSGSPLGTLLIDMKYDAFATPLSNIHLGKGDSTYLLTNEGKVLSPKAEKEDAKINEKPFITKTLEYSKSNSKGIFEVNDKGTTYLVSYFKSKKSGWTAVTVIPKNEVTAGANAIRNRIIIVGLIFALLAVLIGFAFSYKMAADMKLIMKAMENAKGGDLTVSLSSRRKDEIGKLANSFNAMTAQIKSLIMQNKEAAVQVANSSENMTNISKESAKASSEIAKTIEEVASGASNQVTEVESSVNSVSQLAEKINHAVEGTQVMGAASDDVKKLTADGIGTIDILSRKTAETNEITASVVTEISQLDQYVKDINKITGILKGIADQTNLLALNAAIEAARAGEAGKGFAVVADEIRKLAEQSNSFTKEIQNLVGKILKQSENSTELVHKAETTIREQSNIVGQTADVFSKINSSTGILVESIARMAEAISDMDKYKGQVMSSIENMSAVTEQTAASTEEVSASTEEQLASIEELDEMAQGLNDLAQNLISAMEKFKI